MKITKKLQIGVIGPAGPEEYPKDKHAPNYLYTEKAKQVAKDRMIFSENFFKRLEDEINGKI